MSRNPGHLPPVAIGKRVRVRLANGNIGRTDGMSPAGWAADGRAGCRWSITGSPFDIAGFEVIG